jgi:GT2 family glycosyltransferase
MKGLDISVVIVNWNTKALLLECLKSVFESIRDISFEVWLVDNASSDGSVQAVRNIYPSMLVIQNDRNLGFAAANNLAFKRMSGRYAVLLNTDTVLTEDAIRKLHDFMESNSQAGLACGQLLNSDGSKQNSMANFPSLLTLLLNETILRILFPKKFPSKRDEYTSPLEIDSCIGACMMARKKAMEEVGLFDERFFFFLEETDWALRMKRAGWKIYFVPGAHIFHHQGQSVGHGVSSRKIFYTSRYAYFKKWHPRVYPLFFAVIFLRLLVEACLSLAGVLATLGLNPGMRTKFLTYFKLIQWHLYGCPPAWQPC